MLCTNWTAKIVKRVTSEKLKEYYLPESMSTKTAQTRHATNTPNLSINRSTMKMLKWSTQQTLMLAQLHTRLCARYSAAYRSFCFWSFYKKFNVYDRKHGSNNIVFCFIRRFSVVFCSLKLRIRELLYILKRKPSLNRQNKVLDQNAQMIKWSTFYFLFYFDWNKKKFLLHWEKHFLIIDKSCLFEWFFHHIFEF